MKGQEAPVPQLSPGSPRKPALPRRPRHLRKTGRPSGGGTGAVKCHRDRSVEAAAILLTFIGISSLLINFKDQGRIRRYRRSL
jgi:hypothetical protein